MLASIVVPAINEEKYIRRCLDALMIQQHPGFDYEIIVVDNGSTDRTPQIVREYGARLVVQKKRGVAHARQMGFEAAHGEIIASTDADTAPPPDWLMNLVLTLQASPDLAGVYGPIRVYDGKWYVDAGAYYVGGIWFSLNSLIRRPLFCGSNFAVRRSAWLQVGGFDTDWVSAEDLNLSLKLARIGKIKFCWDIQVATSSRRTREGCPAVFAHTLANYMRVTWLNMPPLPFQDIR